VDPFTIMMIASAVLGANKAEGQQFAFKQQQGLEALKTKYNTFTKNGVGQNMTPPNATDPMLQALMAGAMMGKGMKGSPLSADADAAKTAMDTGGVVQPVGATQSLSSSPYLSQGNFNTSMAQQFPFAQGGG
jgi:hypothetical protein